MALTVVWTLQAIVGYNDILDYIESKWTEKEVSAFERQVADFLSRLAHSRICYKNQKPKR